MTPGRRSPHSPSRAAISPLPASTDTSTPWVEKRSSAACPRLSATWKCTTAAPGPRARRCRRRGALARRRRAGERKVDERHKFLPRDRRTNRRRHSRRDRRAYDPAANTWTARRRCPHRAAARRCVFSRGELL